MGRFVAQIAWSVLLFLPSTQERAENRLPGARTAAKAGERHPPAMRPQSHVLSSIRWRTATLFGCSQAALCNCHPAKRRQCGLHELQAFTAVGFIVGELARCENF